MNRQWVIVDASKTTLGRLASQIATRLTGKYKPDFRPNIDEGDYVIVINAANLKVTGNKMKDKKYYRHSQYPGSLKTLTMEQVMEKDPGIVVKKAVAGMLPKNKLAADRMKRLKVYADDKHQHEAQKPQELGVDNG